MVIYLSLLVCLAGLLCYALATNPKVSELGRIAFFAGLLAFLVRVSSESISLIK